MGRDTAYTSILEAIDHGRRALLRSRLSRGITRFLGVGVFIVAVLLVWVLVQQALAIFNVPLAAAVSLAALAAIVAAAVKWILLPILSMPDRSGFVSLVEKRYPESKNVLVNAYQLGREEAVRKHAGAEDLIGAVVKRAHTSLNDFDLARWSSPAEDRRYFWMGGVSLVALVLLGTFVTGPFKLALAQAVNPSLATPPPVSLTVTPGNASVDRGGDLTVSVTVSGTEGAPTLQFREPGGDWRLESFAPQGDISRDGGAWETDLERIERTLEYTVTAPRAQSEVFSVHVNDPPRLQGFRMHVRYPEYTRLSAETVSSASGDIAALKGSQVDLRVLTNVPVTGGYVEWLEDNREAPEQRELAPLDPTQWAVEMPVREPGSYSVVFTNAEGVTVLRSPRFRVDPVPDRAPYMTLHLPQEDHDLYEDMMERVVADAADDYGFSAAEIVYRIDDGPERIKPLRPYTPGQTEFRLDTLWDLSGLDLIPGQTVSFYVRVVDNDVITGPKSVSSSVRRVRFPTVAELYNEIAEEHTQEIETLSDLQESQEEMQERLKKLSDDLKQGQERDWEVEQDVKATLERQDQLEDQLEEVVERLNETMEKADSRADMSQSLVQKMGQLNELLESLSNDDLKRSFQRLSNALSKQNSDELRRAMEDFQSQQEEMLAGLDRTIELLKQIRKEEHVDDLVRQTEEIAELQKEIAEAMEAMGGKPPQGMNEDREGDESAEAGSEDPQGDRAQGEDPEGERAQNENGEQPPAEGDPSEASQEGERPQGDPSQGESQEGEQSESKAAQEMTQEIKDLQKEIDALEKDLAQELAKQRESRESQGKNQEQSGESKSGESSSGQDEQSQNAAQKLQEQLEAMKEAMERALAEAQKKQEQQDLAQSQEAQQQSGQQNSQESQQQNQQGQQNQQSQQGQQSQQNQQGQQQGQQSQEQGQQSQNDGQQQPPEGEQPASQEEQRRMEELAQKQEALRQRVEELKRRLEQLRKLHQDDPSLAQDLEAMEQDQSTQDLSQSMQNSQQSMSSGQKQKSTFYAFKAKEEASRLAQMAESAQENMQGGLQDDTVERMEAIIQGLIDVSRVEESLVVSPHDDEREQARHQFDLVELTQAWSDSLRELSKQTFSIQAPDQQFLDETIGRMERATRLYEMGNERAGNHESKVSVSDLNATIVELMKGHQQMCGGGGGGGSMQQLMEQMQGLSQAQEQLNQQAGRAAQSQGGRLSQTEKKRLEWLAAQQEMIKQGLEEVQKEFSESEQLLGDMESLAQEMEGVEEELRAHNIDKRILERQQKILSRLLDAQRSVRQQEMSPKRQSKTGTLAQRDAPPPLPDELVQQDRALEEDVLRGTQDRYPAQYRKLVEDYFRALTEQTRTP